MKLQQYINKVQQWIDQGRLVLPEGCKALVKKDENGSFYVEIVHSDENHSPLAKAEAILG